MKTCISCTKKSFYVCPSLTDAQLICSIIFKETDEPAIANTSDLNEELGQVGKSS